MIKGYNIQMKYKMHAILECCQAANVKMQAINIMNQVKMIKMNTFLLIHVMNALMVLKCKNLLAKMQKITLIKSLINKLSKFKIQQKLLMNKKSMNLKNKGNTM